MDSMFVDILNKIIAEQGREALLNHAKCKAFLADYTHGEYKKESRLLLQALEAGVQKAIDATGELGVCKQQQARVLREEHFLSAEAAADVVDALALVLRGEQVSGISQVCPNCRKELQKEWKTCPYCSTNVAKTAQAAGSAAQASCEKGMRYYENKDYDTAIAEFTEAIRLDPNNDYFYVIRGNAYVGKGQYDTAIRDCTEAIRLNPNYAFAYGTRGEAYRRIGEYDTTIKDCTEAIRLNPNYAFAYGCRGRAYRQLRQRNQAIQDLEKALSLNPGLEWAEEALRELRRELS